MYFDLLDYMTCTLESYYQSKLTILEIMLLTMKDKNAVLETIINFSTSFIDFVQKMTSYEPLKKDSCVLLSSIEKYFLIDIEEINSQKKSNTKNIEQRIESEKNLNQLLATRTDKLSVYKFQLLIKIVYLKYYFDCSSKQPLPKLISASPIIKSIIRVLDFLKVYLITEEIDFVSFFRNKIFPFISDSKTLGFHNMMIEIFKISECAEELEEMINENLKKLKQINSYNSNLETCFPITTGENSLISKNDTTDKTVSTVYNDELVKYAFPNPKYHPAEPSKPLDFRTMASNRISSPSKSSFSIDPSRNQMFKEMKLNTIKTKNDPNSLIHIKSRYSYSNNLNQKYNDDTLSQSSSLYSGTSLIEKKNFRKKDSMDYNSLKRENPDMAPKAKNRNFGSTFGRKIVALPKRNSVGTSNKNISNFNTGCNNNYFASAFTQAVQEKLLQRQFSKDQEIYIKEKLKQEYEGSEMGELRHEMDWMNNIVDFNTPVKEREIHHVNRNLEEIEQINYGELFKGYQSYMSYPPSYSPSYPSSFPSAQPYSNPSSQPYTNPSFQPSSLPPPPPSSSFRTEYQGILNGLNCWVNLMYAGIGMIGYGKTFVGMSLNGIKTVLRLGIKVLAKVFGFGVFRKMLDWLNKQKDFEGLEGVWGSGRTVEGKFGKMVLFLRIASLIGIAVSYLLSHRLDRKIQLQKINEPPQASSSPVNEPLQSSSQEETLTKPLEEKLEAAFEKEIRSQKEEYSKIRSEEFWHKNLFEEKKEEKKENINPNPNPLPVTPPLSFEAYMGRSEPEKTDVIIKNESIEEPKNDVSVEKVEKNENPFENILFESKTEEVVKREKIVGVAGGKPWMSSRKKN